MSNEQTNPVDEQSQTTPEPVDIAQAFKMVNEANRTTAEGNVADGEAGNTANPEESQQREVSAEPEGTGEPAPTANANESVDTNGGVGGSTTLVEPIDYSPQRQEVLKNIQNQAINDVRKELKDNGIDLWTITDLRQQELDRDGNPTGKVFYRNPDDPDHPFTNRTDAQNFVNSINEEIQNIFRTKVNEKQQELLQKSMPTLRMMDFANTYQSMSQIEKDIFDDLVSPYAISGDNGNVIGFNVDLNSVANTAKQLAKKFGTQQQPAQQQASDKQPNQQQNAGPAMDIKTGNGVSPDEEEPKTIGEALKLVDKRNRKQKEGK